jgi:hypothetical protein
MAVSIIITCLRSTRHQTRIRSPAEPSLSSPAADNFSSLVRAHHSLITKTVQLACSYPRPPATTAIEISLERA